jgi:hypothetical protein
VKKRVSLNVLHPNVCDSLRKESEFERDDVRVTEALKTVDFSFDARFNLKKRDTVTAEYVVD